MSRSARASLSVGRITRASPPSRTGPRAARPARARQEPGAGRNVAPPVPRSPSRAPLPGAPARGPCLPRPASRSAPAGKLLHGRPQSGALPRQNSRQLAHAALAPLSGLRGRPQSHPEHLRAADCSAAHSEVRERPTDPAYERRKFHGAAASRKATEEDLFNSISVNPAALTRFRGKHRVRG